MWHTHTIAMAGAPILPAAFFFASTANRFCLASFNAFDAWLTFASAAFAAASAFAAAFACAAARSFAAFAFPAASAFAAAFAMPAA